MKEDQKKNIAEEVRETDVLFDEDEKLIDLPDISQIFHGIANLFHGRGKVVDAVRKFNWKRAVSIVAIIVVFVAVFGAVECFVGFGTDTYVVVDTSFNQDMGAVLWSPTSEAPHGLVFVYYTGNEQFVGERVLMTEDFEEECQAVRIDSAKLKFRGFATPISVLCGKDMYQKFTNNEFVDYE